MKCMWSSIIPVTCRCGEALDMASIQLFNTKMVRPDCNNHQKFGFHRNIRFISFQEKLISSKAKAFGSLMTYVWEWRTNVKRNRPRDGWVVEKLWMCIPIIGDNIWKTRNVMKRLKTSHTMTKRIIILNLNQLKMLRRQALTAPIVSLSDFWWYFHL